MTRSECARGVRPRRTGSSWTRKTSETFLLLLPIFAQAQAQFQNQVQTDDDLRLNGLREHNELRAKHGSPTLVLNDEMSRRAAECARYYGERKAIDHTCVHSQGIGENIAYSRTRPVQDKIREWYNEITRYDHRYPGLYRETAHFTQMIWRSTQSLGIGQANVDGVNYYVVLYSPQGNAVSRFRDNVPAQRF